MFEFVLLFWYVNYFYTTIVKPKVYCLLLLIEIWFGNGTFELTLPLQVKPIIIFFLLGGVDEKVGIDCAYEEVLKMFLAWGWLKVGNGYFLHREDGILNLFREGNLFLIHIGILIIIKWLSSFDITEFKTYILEFGTQPWGSKEKCGSLMTPNPIAIQKIMWKSWNCRTSDYDNKYNTSSIIVIKPITLRKSLN